MNGSFSFCESGFGNEEIQLKPHLDKTRVLPASSSKKWSLCSLEVAHTTAYIPALHTGKRLDANSWRTTWLFFLGQKELPVEQRYIGFAWRTGMKMSSHNLASLGKLRMLIVLKNTDWILFFFFVKIWHPGILSSYRALLLPATNKDKFMENITGFSPFLIIKTTQWAENKFYPFVK